MCLVHTTSTLRSQGGGPSGFKGTAIKLASLAEDTGSDESIHSELEATLVEAQDPWVGLDICEIPGLACPSSETRLVFKGTGTPELEVCGEGAVEAWLCDCVNVCVLVGEEYTEASFVGRSDDSKGFLASDVPRSFVLSWLSDNAGRDRGSLGGFWVSRRLLDSLRLRFCILAIGSRARYENLWCE